MVSFLAARRVEGGWWTIWLFGFNNQINHLVQLFWVPSSCLGRGEIKKENIYIIGAACVQTELTFFALVDLWKDNVHTEEKGETDCKTSAIVDNNWWLMGVNRDCPTKPQMLNLLNHLAISIHELCFHD